MLISQLRKIKRIWFSVLFIAASFYVANGQPTIIRVPDLSLQGYRAYKSLLTANGFYIGGGIGFAGQSTVEECNFRILLKEKNAVEAFQRLVNKANFEGGLYGLFGLRLKNSETFKKMLSSYKAKGEPPEREWLFSSLTSNIPKGSVSVNGGGFYALEKVSSILKKFELRKYNHLFKTSDTC